MAAVAVADMAVVFMALKAKAQDRLTGQLQAAVVVEPMTLPAMSITEEVVLAVKGIMVAQVIPLVLPADGMTQLYSLRMVPLMVLVVEVAVEEECHLIMVEMVVME
jgi:hypothetical protein